MTIQGRLRLTFAANMDGTATRCRRLFFLCYLLMSTACVFAQNSMVVTVYDSTTRRILTDAIIRISPLAHTSGHKGIVDATDRSGQFRFDISEPVVIMVSYLGYTSITDTLYRAENKSLYIKRSSANIDDVVITGQYTPGTSRSSVYDIKVYTQKDFRDKGATNLREALQGSLNIDMTQDAVFGSGISLRGISGPGVKIMVDGVPLVGRVSGNLDLSQVNLSNIERVEIIKGPMSAVYGSDAMGGVVNLISKTNQADKYMISLKGYYESVGQYNVELNGGVHIGRSQFYAAAGRNFFDGFSQVDTSRHKDWLPKEQYFANAKYVYTHPKFKIGATASFLREMVIDRGDREVLTTYAFDQHFLTYRQQASIFASVPTTSFSQIDMFIAYSGFVRHFGYYKKDLVTLQENLLTNQQNDTSFYHDIIGRATYTLSTANKKLSFQFGTDLTQEYTSQTLIQGQKHQMGDYAVFGSVKWKPIDGLDIQPALRFGYNTRFQSPLIPSVNIKYDFAEHFNMRASYGLGYRAPTLYEMYLDFHDVNHNLDGNDSLHAEKGHAVSLSFGYLLVKHDHRFRITGTGFFNKINNKIDFFMIQAAAPGRPAEYTYGNVNRYMTSGGEAEAEYNWRRVTASLGFDYIWYNAYAVNEGTGVATNTTLVSPDLTVRMGYKIPKAEISVNVFYKYSGQKLNFFLGGGTSTGIRDGFHSMDVSLSRDFWRNRILVTCGAKNLFNITNVQNNGVAAFGHGSGDGNTLVNWGRTYFISLNLRFAK